MSRDLFMKADFHESFKNVAATNWCNVQCDHRQPRKKLFCWWLFFVLTMPHPAFLFSTSSPLATLQTPLKQEAAAHHESALWSTVLCCVECLSLREKLNWDCNQTTSGTLWLCSNPCIQALPTGPGNTHRKAGEKCVFAVCGMRIATAHSICPPLGVLCCLSLKSNRVVSGQPAVLFNICGTICQQALSIYATRLHTNTLESQLQATESQMINIYTYNIILK